MPRTTLKPTIRQVAQACKVSPMTVSAVLNNKSSEVGKDTRERVLKVVREMGYRPTAATHAPHVRQVPIYGVLAGVPGSSLMQPGYYNAILRGILARVDHLGHNVLLFANDAFHADVQQSIRIYCDGRCDGMLIIAPPPGSPLVQAMQERGLPFIVIGSTCDPEDVPCVDVDNAAEACRIVEYLIAQGHRRIAFLGDPSGYPGDPNVPCSVTQRRRGYEQALARHGIALDATFPTNIGPHDVQTYQQTVYLLRQPAAVRPTAIFCWHDGAALPVYQAIQDLGLRVPVDVSVVGFDGDPLIADMEPPLTTIRQPYAAIGEAAVNMLTQQVQDRHVVPGRRFVPAELVVRRSVAPPLALLTPEAS